MTKLPGDISRLKGVAQRRGNRPLDPLNNPDGMELLHETAYLRGWRVRFKDGRIILNPYRLKLSSEAYRYLRAAGELRVVTPN